jgi:hypothetical protein
MLDDDEWAEVEPLLANAIEQIKRYRAEHGVSLHEARRDAYGKEALERTSRSPDSLKPAPMRFGTTGSATSGRPAMSAASRYARRAQNSAPRAEKS